MPRKRGHIQLSPAQAANAIYIDFECLKVRPPAPEVLGVLFGADDEQIEQLILDARLAPAARASRRTRVSSVADAAGSIVAAAHSHGQHIVGWSFFDCDRMIEARPDLAPDIRARYVNAIQIARPWRLKIYPGFRIARDDDFAPKHTLDKYARLARYPHSKALVGATPAKWIRHVLQQLEARGGRYRQVTKQAKGAWLRLLEYNRHDLLALRHIVLRATRESEAWRAYEKTRFCVDDGPKRICFMAGSQNRRLEALLERHNARSWAFITAWNPRSDELSREQNDARQSKLRQAVAAYKVLLGEGVGQDPSWTADESLLILNISRRKAQSLGRRFGQLAIVVGRRGEKSELLPVGAWGSEPTSVGWTE